MKTKYIVGAVAAVIVVVTAALTVQSRSVPYATFDSARETGARMQIAGTWEKKGGSSYDAEKNEFRFQMRDTLGTVMPVVLNGAKPNNFELATSMTATGHVEGGEFRATQVLTKCPSKYESGGVKVEGAAAGRHPGSGR